jgi:hypothetical protein
LARSWVVAKMGMDRILATWSIFWVVVIMLGYSWIAGRKRDWMSQMLGRLV